MKKRASFTTRRRRVSEKLVERGGCDSISASVAYELHKPPLSFRTPLSLLAIILTKSGVAFHRSRLTRGSTSYREQSARWCLRQVGSVKEPWAGRRRGPACASELPLLHLETSHVSGVVRHDYLLPLMLAKRHDLQRVAVRRVADLQVILSREFEIHGAPPAAAPR